MPLVTAHFDASGVVGKRTGRVLDVFFVFDAGMSVFLSGITDEMKQRHRERLFDVTRENLLDVAERFELDTSLRFFQTSH